MFLSRMEPLVKIVTMPRSPVTANGSRGSSAQQCATPLDAVPYLRAWQRLASLQEA